MNLLVKLFSRNNNKQFFFNYVWSLTLSTTVRISISMLPLTKAFLLRTWYFSGIVRYVPHSSLGWTAHDFFFMFIHFCCWKFELKSKLMIWWQNNFQRRNFSSWFLKRQKALNRISWNFNIVKSENLIFLVIISLIYFHNLF